MANTAEEHESEGRPSLIFHGPPSASAFSIFPFVKTKFVVLDPRADPPHPSFPALSKAARLMLCWGPTPVTSEDLARYPALECIVGSSAGLNHFDLDACRRRGVRVTSAGEVFSDDVADYTVGLAIDVLRRLTASDRFLRAGFWPLETGFALGSKVTGKRIGIVGLGSIGTRVAKRFEAFDCTIAYTSRKIKPGVSYPFYPNIVDLASNVDVLVLCCPLTDKTHHLVEHTVMTALGKSGVIINVGRGGLIDEKELVEFLVRGDIGGAGLDVFENEPHVPDELMKLENVVLSPHRAVLTPDSLAALADLVRSNLEAFCLDKPLQTEVNFE
ncbi:glyoxylate/hydroxypyruvate reductase HPR3-like [Andrographis paniculata]|uniref:glyoxylate/hydroxypyruvate reductase HPR3-like n=1 Tax=Andrographis paniculata TaxID=175694 RepID=UPI0021E975BA|nr:glyoxylate/hydroxypyruvate reductase HPR3-like [Andrographis paniculata]